MVFLTLDCVTQEFYSYSNPSCRSSSSDMNNTYRTYDRTFMPDEKFGFVVITDMHFILDPEP